MLKDLKSLMITVVAAVLFMGSCVAMLPVAVRLADPMTRQPLDSSDGSPFPILVVTGATGRVEMLGNPRQRPVPPPGSTYLVPPGKSEEIEQYLWRHEPRRDGDGSWTLRVEERSPALQRIELLWSGDGFSGGVYDAESTRVTPLYRKLTGPGFAFMFGPLAIALNLGLWALVRFLWRRHLERRARRAA